MSLTLLLWFESLQTCCPANSQSLPHPRRLSQTLRHFETAHTLPLRIGCNKVPAIKKNGTSKWPLSTAEAGLTRPSPSSQKRSSQTVVTAGSIFHSITAPANNPPRNTHTHTANASDTHCYDRRLQLLCLRSFKAVVLLSLRRSS